MGDPQIIAIGDILVSTALLRERFACDITLCKGACCVDGNSGAPLEFEELGILEKEYVSFADFMSPQGKEAIRQQGFAVMDGDGEWVTPLIAGGECAYAVFDGEGVCRCAIEEAFWAQRTVFRKPVSCWLYPIRVQKLSTGLALNYHQWKICVGQSPTPLYRFLKEPLIIQFGQNFYDQLDAAAAMIDNRYS